MNIQRNGKRLLKQKKEEINKLEKAFEAEQILLTPEMKQKKAR